MNIRAFCSQYGSNTRKASDVIQEWERVELDGLLRALEEQHDQLIGSAVIAADAIHGDGMLDQISDNLRDAFVNLMHEKADTYGEMRRILLDRIQNDEGEFLPLDSSQVVNFISKLKGQIGENVFQQQVGSIAELAPSGSQEGWDVVLKHANGAHEYVQVKLYADPHGVIEHMLAVQGKVAHGLQGYAGHMVDHVDFAVPADVAGRVDELKELYPQLDSMHVLTIEKMDAHQAAGLVRDGISNVGPDELHHFFHELLGGAVAVGSLHAIVNGFLWYKGAKEFSSAFAATIASTSISTAGIGIGLVADMLYHTAVLSGAAGIGTRVLLARMARSRWSFAEFLEKSIADANAWIASLQRCPGPAVGYRNTASPRIAGQQS